MTPGRVVIHPPPPKAEVNERVELYLCFSFWAFMGSSGVNLYLYLLP
jgi:hypothetical protein